MKKPDGGERRPVKRHRRSGGRRDKALTLRERRAQFRGGRRKDAVWVGCYTRGVGDSTGARVLGRGHMTDVQLDEIEAALGVTLPTEYRQVSRAFPFRPVGRDRVYWFFD